MFKKITGFIRSLFNTDDFIPLHEPKFFGNEKKYLNECIDSTFVSSVGKFVDLFEDKIAKYTGAKYAVATVNGTAALHISLELAGVKRGDEVLTQALTFVATCNAISYIGAHPVFVDVERKTLGLSADALEIFLEAEAIIDGDKCINKSSGKKISAVVAMHTFGNPCEVIRIAEICKKYKLILVEDAAESLGSYVNGVHTGLFGQSGVLSFNGNKTITTGGGGMIITNDKDLAKRAKFLTTTAKIAHPYKFIHTEIGYNYRMPNLNAALGCAQLEKLDYMLENKKELAKKYNAFFNDISIEMVMPSKNSTSNNWLNAIIFENKRQQQEFLEYSNSKGVMARPIWEIMPSLEMFKDCQTDGLVNTKWLVDRVVNIPSSVRRK
jgi:aminotransferase in exopolysaccharide biosynthesis